MRNITYRRNLYQGKNDKKKSKPPKIKDENLLMFGKSSKFLNKIQEHLRKIKFFLHVKTEKFKADEYLTVYYKVHNDLFLIFKQFILSAYKNMNHT